MFVAAGCSKAADTTRGEDSAALLRDAAAASVSAGSLKFSFNAAIDGQLQVHTEFAGKPAGNGSGRVQTGQRNIPFLAIDDRFYIGYADVAPDKKWVVMSLQELENLGVSATVGDQRDPQQALALLSSVKEPVQKVGTETLNGVPATRYRCTIDIKALLAAPGGGFSADGARRLSGLVGDSAVIDAWRGDDGKIHRISYGVDLAKSPARPSEFPETGKLAYQYDFSDYGKDLSVETPAPDQVMTLDEYKASPRAEIGEPPPTTTVVPPGG